MKKGMMTEKVDRMVESLDAISTSMVRRGWAPDSGEVDGPMTATLVLALEVSRLRETLEKVGEQLDTPLARQNRQIQRHRTGE